jgi:hypothetical protein
MVNHRGCPTTSLADAREWREYYASNRPAAAHGTQRQRDRNSSEKAALIPFAAARDTAGRHYDEILDLVLALPKNVAAQCNPADPQLALTVLESECTYILCKAYEVYAAWSKGGPHISTVTNAK